MKGVCWLGESNQHCMSAGRERSRGHILFCIFSKSAFLPNPKPIYLPLVHVGPCVRSCHIVRVTNQLVTSERD